MSGAAGTEEQGFGTIRYGGKLGNEAYYRIYAKGFDRDTSAGTQPAPVDDWSAVRGGFRADSQFGEVGSLTLQGDFFESDAERIDLRPHPAAPFVYTNAEREVSDGANILARWTHGLESGSNWAVQAYWD